MAQERVNTERERPGVLLDVEAVAALLDCSPRHVYRLADAALMPRPVHLGALVRWPRAAIMDWIGRGCPSCRGPADHAKAGGQANEGQEGRP